MSKLTEWLRGLLKKQTKSDKTTRGGKSKDAKNKTGKF